MKHRKIMGSRIKGTRERGAWAEMYFMVLAMSYGLKVSSPYGGLGPYDVGVEDGPGPILRVQVKCTLYQCSHRQLLYERQHEGWGEGPARVRSRDGGLFRDLHYSYR